MERNIYPEKGRFYTARVVIRLDLMPDIVPGTAIDIWARDQQQVYTLLLVFPHLVPESIFLRVTEQRLPGSWREMKELLEGEIYQVSIND
jgi:hypothetical protein